MREKFITLVSRAGLKLLFVLFLFASGFSSYAQYTPPILSDNLLGTGINPNSATIDYTPFPNGYSGPNPTQLTTVVADDPSGGAPLLYVNDNVSSPVSVTLPVTTATWPYHPDVIIGNDIINTGQYLIGIVINDGADIYLLEYSVSGQGSALSVNLISVTNVSGPGIVLGTAPHIDVIAQYASPYFGYPVCDNFAIVWEGIGTSGYNDLYGYSASLSTPSSGAPTLLVNGTPYHGTDVPDVAAVERKTATGFHNVALIVLFTALSTPKVTYMEWDITSGSILSPVPSINGMFDAPRIDAIDDFHFNHPSGSNAYYTISVSGTGTPPGSLQTVYAISNLGVTDIIASAGIPNQNGFKNATVACGPDQYYTINYFTRTNSTGYNTYFSQQTDWLGNLQSPWYQVPMNTVTGILNAVSATCNTENATQQLFSVWDDGCHDLYDKYAQLTGSGGPIVSYRPAKVNSINKDVKWLISPNPSNDQLTLTNTAVDLKGTTYSITDITGRFMQQGDVNSNSEYISVGALTPGIYTLHVYDHKELVKNMQFVKQ